MMERRNKHCRNRHLISIILALYVALASPQAVAQSDEKLPSILQIIEQLIKKHVSEFVLMFADPWALGDVIRDYHHTNADWLRTGQFFDHVGQFVKHGNERGAFEFSMSETGIAAAVWLTGEQAVEDYLAFRQSQNWAGKLPRLPRSRALAFRRVEAALILFENALLKPQRNTSDPPDQNLTANHPLMREALAEFHRTYDDMRDGLNEWSILPEHLVVWFYDLNGDGTPEALVNLQHSSYCGSSSCDMSVYFQTGERWRKVGWYKASWVAVIADDDRAYDGLFGKKNLVRWSARRDEFVHHCFSVECWKYYDSLTAH